MGDYILNETIEQLNKLFQTYEQAYETSPFSLEIIENAKKLTEDFVQKNIDIYEVIRSKNKEHNQNLEKILNKYHTDIYNSTTILDEKIEEIKNHYAKLIDEINEQIEVIKQNNELEIVNYKNDISYYIAASIQSLKMLDSENDSNIKKYDYQIYNARDYYNDNINKYNTELDKLLINIKNKYDNSIVDFNKNIEDIIKNYEDSIEQKNKELAFLEGERQNAKFEIKEKNRKESIQLNNSIKSLNQLRNSKIDEARDIYKDVKDEAKLALDEVKQESEAQAQSVSKLYMNDITKINNLLNDYKKEYLEKTENLSKEFEYIKYNISKNLGIKLELLYNNDAFEANYSKKAAKKLKRNAYILTEYESKKYNKELSIIKRNYDNLTLKCKNDLSISESKKNCDLKNISDKLLNTNKIFQERINIKEIDMNNAISEANTIYNKHANTVKAQSQIKIKNIESQTDKIDSTFLRQIETIKSDINVLKLEIDASSKLHEQILNYELDKYNKSISYYTVNNLLEIEKVKALDNYNKRQYDYNVKSANLNIDDNGKKIDISIKEFKKITDLNIERSIKIKERDISNASYAIKKRNIEETYKKRIENRINKFETAIRNEALLNERFEEEKVLINAIITNFYKLELCLSSFIEDIYKLFFTDVVVSADTISYLTIFVKSFGNIIYNHHSALTEFLLRDINNILKRRQEFEFDYKYNSYLDSLKQRYEKNYSDYENRKKEINENLIKTNEIIIDCDNKIFSYENNIAMLFKRLTEDKDNDNSILESINSYKNKISDIKNEIKAYKEAKHTLADNYKNIQLENSKNKAIYQKKLKEVEIIQAKTISSYANFDNNITKLISKYKAQLTKLLSMAINAKPSKDYKKQISLIIEDIKVNNIKLNKGLMNLYNKFIVDSNNIIKKNNHFLNLEYKNSLKLINISLNDTILANLKDSNKACGIILSEISNIDAEIERQKKHFIQMKNQNEESYNKNNDAIMNDKAKSLEQFYNDYLSICKNQEELTSDYNKYLTVSLDNLKKAEADTIKDLNNEKKRISDNLKLFYQKQEELVNHLPSALKFQSREIDQKTKELNLSLDEQLKIEKYKVNNLKRSINKKITDFEYQTKESINANNYKHQKEVRRILKSKN